MIEQRALELVLVLLASLAAALLLAWLAYAVWRMLRIRRMEPLVERARGLLLRDLADGRIRDETEGVMGALPFDLQTWALTIVARQISGRQRSLLAALARATGLYGRAESDCRRQRWTRRVRGLQVFTLLGDPATAAVPLLRDPHPQVRARAAEWAVHDVSPPIIAALVQRLDDRHPEVRFAAADSLLRMGAPAAERIARHLSEPVTPGTARLLDVAAGIRDTSFIHPALHLTRAEDPAIRSRAITLLGLIGGEASVARAGDMLDDASEEVRKAAVGALGSLGHWPAAPQVGARLRDPAWAVRREAGLALREMGAPGELVLRGALRDPDRYAADMARMTLALPDRTLAGS